MSAAPVPYNTLGLYINSVEKGTNSSEIANPYKYLLGSDGYGTYPTGNKINELIAYMNTHGYNYGLLYGTSGTDFVSSGANSQVFSTNGVNYLKSILNKLNAASIDPAIICDLFLPNLSSGIYDGTSQIRKLYDYYVNHTAADADRFSYINIETEFWNFPGYNSNPGFYSDFNPTNPAFPGFWFEPNTTVGGFSGNVSTLSYGSAWSSQGAWNPAISANSVLGTSLGIYDFVQIQIGANKFYRQVIGIVSVGSGKTIVLDRPFTTSSLNGNEITTAVQNSGGILDNSPGISYGTGLLVNIRAFDPESTVDYETYLYRLNAIRNYLSSFPMTSNDGVTPVKLEAYFGFPDYYTGYDVQGSFYSHTPLFQFPRDPWLRRFVGILDRHLLHNYTYIPSYSRIRKRLVFDILKDTSDPVHIGTIISAESAGFNNKRNCNCDGYDSITGQTLGNYDYNFNFSGHFLEGRGKCLELVSQGSGSQAGNCTDNSTGCGSQTTAFVQAVADPLKDNPDVWEYIVADPAPATAPSYSVPTFNEIVNGTEPDLTNIYTDVSTFTDEQTMISAGNLTFDTLVVFDQEFIRQLTTTSLPTTPYTFTPSPTSTTCNGDTDGSITITVNGGTGPFSIDVDSVNVVVGASSPYTITGLAAGTYTIDVYDDGNLADPATNNGQSVTVSEPTSISVSKNSDDDTYCDGEASIVLNTITGGTPNYTFSVYTSPGGTLVAGPYIYITGQNNLRSYSGLVLDGNTTYEIIVTDSNGCTNSLIFTTDPVLPFGVTASAVNPACNGGTGSINNIRFTGTSYVSKSTTASDPANEIVFQLNGTALDGNGAAVDLTGSVITVTIGGVTTTYPYVPLMDFTGLSAGTYTIDGYVVVDGLPIQCPVTSTNIVISDPAPATVSTVNSDPSCWYSCDGSIVASASGGISNPIYYWSTGFVGATATNLCKGTYTVTALGDNGCSAFTTVNLGQNLIPLEITYRIFDVPEDFDGPGGTVSGGAIYIDSVTGGGSGFITYTYAWTGPNGFTATSDDILDLEPGTYILTITTDKGCSRTYEFILKYRCDQFTLGELKTQLFKFQCCTGALAKEYVQLQRSGRDDLAKCKVEDLRFMTMALDRLMCIEDLATNCFSCDDINNLLSQMKKICDCDCCNPDDLVAYTVRYNTQTGMLDAEQY